MPKQKRASSALCARQAKKRKRSQRQDPVKQEGERNARRSQYPRSHSSPEVSLDERRRERDAEAHRSARLDPQRRQQE